MTDRPPRRPGARAWAALALVLAAVAAVALVVAATGQQRAPQPPAAAAADAATPDPAGDTVTPDAVPAPAAPSQAAPVPAAPVPAAPVPAEPVAAPVSLEIPAIDVRSDLLRLGVSGDGTVQVPPLAPDDRAGWYERGPAPGAVGPAVVLGHVDSAEWGPGVFFDLGALQPGDEVTVAREDGSVAVFAVDRVERHRKDDFPTIAVYGNTDAAELRLITCGGAFDAGAGSYEDNVIAFASLVDTRRA
ncbi:class F sortase [Geodermatophilus sp. DSM 44513]|uniref:class F sortase n=1 Tax=Geodermatophilus sp. DSM 44513 TaxID=1528104 RepID=UPI0012809CAB|nr:class F sortase [Geodermatophilus sp. DSM 44513]WNV77716.1 class F sortase [Geodermatophilus sp. DSM 44513]